MKNPHPLGKTWNASTDKDPVLISVPGSNKRFKRKSREPKRLFSSPEPETVSGFPVDVPDVGDAQVQVCSLSGSSQEVTAGPPSGRPEAGGAIDMRIGINVPSITSKLSQPPASPFPLPEISHWPAAISQPLSHRLRQGLRSVFPLSTSSSSSFSLDPPLSGHADPGPPQTSQCLEHVEPEVQSPKGSPRKRVGASAERPGRPPEVRAVQQTRRLLANARERTRVHTISAAFEALRKQVPCYSYGQKLSKLAILRIACNYILSLAQLAEPDPSPDRGGLSFSQCVEQCTRTLQAEGRSKKRKVGRMPEDV